MAEDIIVLGAGVIGATIGAALAQAGHRVRIVDRRTPGRLTASQVSFACINSNNKTPQAYHALNMAGIAAHRRIAASLGNPGWYRLEGTYEWRRDQTYRAAHLARVERLQAQGYAAEWVAPETLLARAPLLDRAAIGDAPVAFYAEEGWVETGAYVGHMLAEAKRNGADLIPTEAQPHLLLSGQRVLGVEIGGASLTADLVVNAAGAAVNEPTEEAGLHLPMDSTPGMTILTAPVEGRFETMIRTDISAVRPAPGGGLLLHSLGADRRIGGSAEAPETRAAAAEVIDRIRDYLGGIPLQIAALQLTRRPMTRDGYPAVGPVPGWDNYLLAVSHSGVTLAPLIAEAVTALASGQPPAPLWADYAPGRYFTPAKD